MLTICFRIKSDDSYLTMTKNYKMLSSSFKKKNKTKIDNERLYDLLLSAI